jgi:uncharacterized membrane protein YcaP (DUF421 family)
VENSGWFLDSGAALAQAVLTVVAVYVAVVLYTRIAGLRSFSKMTTVDFVMTVAVGSLVASTALSSDPPLLRGAVVLAALFAIQASLVWARRRSKVVRRIVENTPALLMREGQFLPDALRRHRVAREDVIAKLREANVLRLEDVRAVVLEVTGDISVLHGDGPVDDVLFEEVRGGLDA